MQATREIFESAFAFVAAGTTNVEFNPDDLSRASALRLTLLVSTADTDAADTLDVKIQERGPSGIWNTRARFKAITGDLTPSAGTPELLRLVLEADGPLSSTEEAYEPSGSSGGSEPTVIGDGVVINGPFVGVYRTAAGRGASWRAQFVVTDGSTGGNVSFAGTLYASVMSRY